MESWLGYCYSVIARLVKARLGPSVVSFQSCPAHWQSADNTDRATRTEDGMIKQSMEAAWLLLDVMHVANKDAYQAAKTDCCAANAEDGAVPFNDQAKPGETTRGELRGAGRVEAAQAARAGPLSCRGHRPDSLAHEPTLLGRALSLPLHRASTATKTSNMLALSPPVDKLPRSSSLVSVCFSAWSSLPAPNSTPQSRGWVAVNCWHSKVATFMMVNAPHKTLLVQKLTVLNPEIRR